ncbi:MAG: LacI family DNA-binding transcriptional regulator [Oscillospiraceae bacterium]
MSATIKDVAKASGVSVATVSRVLNNSASVSEATAKQVNDAIKALNYRPNFLGRNLRKCETNIILAVVPSTEYTYYSQVIHGMQSKATELGYDLLISTSNSHYKTERKLLNMLTNRIVDAAVFMGTRLESELLTEMNEQFCVSLCCERVPDCNLLTVTVDDEKAAYDAVSCLIAKGHRDIAMISTGGNAHSSSDREHGYKRALKEHGIEQKGGYLFQGGYDYKNGGFAFEKFMSLAQKPTAIFAISDMLAIGACKKASEMGIAVGKDIAVMGFDNIAATEMYVPSISTVEQPCYKMGRIVIEKTVENLTEKKNYGRYIVDHRVILRQSTGD